VALPLSAGLSDDSFGISNRELKDVEVAEMTAVVRQVAGISNRELKGDTACAPACTAGVATASQIEN